MKVGIITYHRSYNYGAQLQAYALCTFLRKMGCDAEVIDCNKIGRSTLFHWSFNSIRGFMGALRNNILSFGSDIIRRKRFNNFSDRFIYHSAPCFTKEELNNIVQQYDYVITGSDQVWHPQICEGQTCFFLDFPIDKEKKIAYAPSFGIDDYSPAEVDRYMPLIDNIGQLSVREKKGQEIIMKYLGRHAELVIDPTMLLGKEEWGKLAIDPQQHGYLFYFTILDEPEGTDKLVKDIASRMNLKIVRIGALKDLLKAGFVNGRASGPQEFLGLVSKADFIVTSSFHGTVFSILFEKQFITILNNNDRNSRMETLLENLNLGIHVVKDVNNFTFGTYEKINYEFVTPLVSKLKYQSQSFLQKALCI